MIILSRTVCADCQHCSGIDWSGKGESTEYIKCDVAYSGDAKDLITWHGTRSECPMYKSVGDYSK